MNKYNQFNYRKALPYRMNKHISKDYNQRSNRKYQRRFNLLDIVFLTNGLQHYSNCYYYFYDMFKGVKPFYVRGDGVYDLKTNRLLKSYHNDPILGWCFYGY